MVTLSVLCVVILVCVVKVGRTEGKQVSRWGDNIKMGLDLSQSDIAAG